MGLLRLVVAGVAIAVPCSAQAQDVAYWRPYSVEAARRFAIPLDWIERVMWHESRGRAMFGGRPITSSAGAMGLMQLMPATWATMRSAYALGSDPYDPHDNIVAGAAYLRLLYDRFGYPGMFAAYSAGPSRYTAYLSGQRGLPGETIRYLVAMTGAAPIAAPMARPLLIAAAPETPKPIIDPLFAIAPRQ
jgi:soluble lytic murein transglycosylase-like protein